MARMDVGNGITPAWQNMVRVLFRPFSLTKWLSLGFISLLAFGGGGGSFNFPTNYGEQHPNWPNQNPWPWIVDYWPFLLAGFLVLFAIGLILGWIGSVLNFVYVDNIVRNSGAIAEPFARLRSRGTSYFLWRLAFAFTYLIALALIIGTPLIWVFAVMHGAGTGLMVMAVVWAVLAGIPLIIVGVIIDLFVRDFVVTVMYVRGVGIMEAWHIAWPIIKQNAGQVALYIAILIAVSIGIGMFGLFVALFCAVIIGIPVAILAVIAVFAGKAMGLNWSIPIIVVAAVFGGLVGLGLVYLVSCAAQPAYVFRRSYPLVVMGQADPSLETIPTGLPPTTQQETP